MTAAAKSTTYLQDLADCVRQVGCMLLLHTWLLYEHGEFGHQNYLCYEMSAGFYLGLQSAGQRFTARSCVSTRHAQQHNLQDSRHCMLNTISASHENVMSGILHIAVDMFKAQSALVAVPARHRTAGPSLLITQDSVCRVACMSCMGFSRVLLLLIL